MLRKIKLLYWRFLQWRNPDNLPCIEEAKSALKIADARTLPGLRTHKDSTYNGVYITLMYYTKGLSIKEIQTAASIASISYWSHERIRQLIIKGVRNARADSNHGL